MPALASFILDTFSHFEALLSTIISFTKSQTSVELDRSTACCPLPIIKLKSKQKSSKRSSPRGLSHSKSPGDSDDKECDSHSNRL
jgi:hypothetical protein